MCIWHHFSAYMTKNQHVILTNLSSLVITSKVLIILSLLKDPFSFYKKPILLNHNNNMMNLNVVCSINNKKSRGVSFKNGIIWYLVFTKKCVIIK